MTQLRYGAATDVGKVRSNNEDQLLVAEPVFAVADGMGGHAAGEVASQAAVDAMRAAFGRVEPPYTMGQLVEAIEVANRVVWERSVADPDLRGMGTTLTAVAVIDEEGEDHVAIANVGDSRAYLLRDGTLDLLTADHSVAEQMVRDGQLTPEEAAVHPQRHVLTRVLGMAPDVEVDAYPILPYKGDRYLLCSDGLINEVTDDQIASALRRLADPDEAAKELVHMARAGGGHDNITVIVVDVVDDDDRAEAASAALAGEPPALTGGATMLAPVVPEVEVADEPPADTTVRAERPSPQPHEVRRHSRRITFRVVLFVVVLLAVLAGAAVAVGLYARGTYYVGFDGDQVAIFKGRPGGLLWFQPTVESHAGLSKAQVPPSSVDDLQS
ncbi:MAG: putative serine/threonine protein phosphatase, partial [Acidimicrobiales bacterium]|nr:putative serine/threonine protein phosphatase [Acidimicrobiales bacterium]